MKRFVSYCPVVALGFYAGLLIYGLWPSAVTASTSVDKPINVAFCELLREPERYHGKLIQTKAILHRDQQPFIYDWSCKPSEVYTKTPLVKVVSDTRHTLPAWADGTTFCANALSANEVGLAADINIVGTFQADYLTPNSVPDFKIIPQRIEQVSPAAKRP